MINKTDLTTRTWFFICDVFRDPVLRFIFIFMFLFEELKNKWFNLNQKNGQKDYRKSVEQFGQFSSRRFKINQFIKVFIKKKAQ